MLHRRHSIALRYLLAMTAGLAAQAAQAREIAVTCSGIFTSNNSNSYQTFKSRTEQRADTFTFDTVSKGFTGRNSDGSPAPGGKYEVRDGQLGFCRDLCGSDTRPGRDGEVLELDFPKVWIDINSGTFSFMTAITSRSPNGEFFRQQSTFSGRCDVSALKEVADEERAAADAAMPAPAPAASGPTPEAKSEAVQAENAKALEASRERGKAIEAALATSRQQQADFDAAVAEARRRNEEIIAANASRQKAYEERLALYKACTAGDQNACTKYQNAN